MRFSLRLHVAMDLMCGPRQLFFLQCGPEMPKGWTPLYVKEEVKLSLSANNMILYIENPNFRLTITREKVKSGIAGVRG